MRTLVLDLGKYVPGFVVPALVGIAEIRILTSLFEPDDYGLYSLAMSSIALTVLITGWMGTTIVRFYPAAERRGQVPALVATMLKIYAGTAVLGSLAGIAVLILLPYRALGDLGPLLWVCIPVFVLLSLSHTLQQFYRARRQIAFFNALVMWQHVGRLGLGLLLAVVFDLGVAGLLWGYALALLIGVPPVLILSKLPVRGGHRRVESPSGADGAATPVAPSPPGDDLDGGSARALLRYGWPLALCNVGGWAIMYVDRYILQISQGAEAVGIYSASYNISERLMVVVLSLFLLASRPLEMSSWEKSGGREMATALRNTTRLYILGTLPLVVLISVLARELLQILAGAGYVEAYRVVPYFACGAFLLGIHQRYQGPLLVRQKTALILVLFTISGLFNVALNSWLVPRFGYHASAVVKLLSYALLAAATILVARRYLSWEFPSASLFRCLPALLAAGYATYQANRLIELAPLVDFVLAGSLGLLVYALGLLVLGELSADERQKLAALIRSRR